MLNAFLARFPSRRNLWAAFLVCVFPTHFWAYTIFFRELPSYLMHLSIAACVPILAYVQLYALLESIVIWFILVAIGVILPERRLRTNFIQKITIFVILTSIWLAIFQLRNVIIRYFELGISLITLQIGIFVWVVGYFVIVMASYVLLRRKTVFGKALDIFVEKISVLSLFYLSLDFVYLVIILYRNLIGDL